MKRSIAFAILFSLPALCVAQGLPEAPLPRQIAKNPDFGRNDCAPHCRKFGKPQTWLESNMTQQEYVKWVTPRLLHDHWYKDKPFWGGTAAMALLVAADAHSTVIGQPRFTETNPLLGKHPSDGRVAGFEAINFGAHFALHLAAWKLSHFDNSKAWRLFGQWGVPAGVAGTTGRAAIHNYKLAGKL